MTTRFRVHPQIKQLVLIQKGDEPSDADGPYALFCGDPNLAAAHAKSAALILDMYERGVLMMRPTIERVLPPAQAAPQTEEPDVEAGGES